jgi:hypothetical protein
MMSAQGQGDQEVAKVTLLHSAAVGYASLIWDLKPETNLDGFLQKCKPLWKALEVDEYLPRKLVSLNMHFLYFCL